MIVTMFSSGAASWMAAKLARDQHPEELHVLLFSDVLGEDQDNYRFLVESAANVFQIDLPAGWRDLVPTGQVSEFEHIRPLREFAAEHLPNLVWLVEGRNIWQVFHDKRFLGNSRQANCSHLLKQKPARDWLEANASPTEATIVVGLDALEVDRRLPAVQRGWAPYEVKTPLADRLDLDKEAILAGMRALGVEPPRLYDMGFAHANCGGGCVRAGQGQFIQLLEVMPERFAMWEQGEEGMREYLDREVSILRNWTSGGRLPLVELRGRVEAKREAELDRLDIGGCGCFVDGE
jgi:hypothetical protein